MPGKLNQPDPCVPGPGNYDYIKEIGHDRRKPSMGPKYAFNDITVMELKKNVPGPGHYPDKLSFDKEGKYVVSQF
jgi:hypothetical protein